jgi:hypothetical protein
MHFSFRNQFRLLEGLRPPPVARESGEKGSEEPTARSVCTEDFGQPTSQFVTTEEAGTCMDTPQRGCQLSGDVMGPASGVAEQAAQFEYAWGCQHIDYEQSTPQTWPTEQISMNHNDTWPAGTWVSTLHGGNPFCVDSVSRSAQRCWGPRAP